jgi:hypothetical protein
MQIVNFLMNKNIWLTAILLVSFLISLKAQVYDKKTVHAGQSLAEVSYYLFPSFRDAKVQFKKGGELVSKLNFNLLICQMQFIDPKGDTLNLARPDDIDEIDFDSTSFFYNEGYYQVLADIDGTRLAVLRKVSYEPIKIGALGLRNHSGTGTEEEGSFVHKSGDKELNEDVDITKETTFFLIAGNGEIIRANRSGFLKVFSKNSQSIKTYIKENKPDFNKESDLKKLFRFCTNVQ